MRVSIFSKRILRFISSMCLGGALMFPAFTVIASDDLLANFQLQANATNISQNVAYALMEKNAAIIIDVRSREEYAQDHIANSYNIPLNELDKSKELELLRENDTPVLLYCRSGRRSGMAAEFLSNKGYKYLMNMGGVITWEYGLTKDEPELPFAQAIKNVKPLK